MSDNPYAERDTMALDRYAYHVDAMTRFGLHAKPDIAAELAWRDQQIDVLRELLAEAWARERGDSWPNMGKDARAHALSEIGKLIDQGHIKPAL